MLLRKKSVFIGLLLVSVWAVFPFSGWALSIEAISAPSVDILLSFTMTGRVSGIRVKEGDLVQKGDLLCSLDDGAEKIKVAELAATAEDTSRMAAAAAELDQKRIDLEKLESAHDKGAVTRWELEHAKLDVQIAELALEAAELEHDQSRRRLEQAVSQLERMRLVSPVSGCVEALLVTAGESARALDPILQLIQVDPLWIETPVPINQARGLANGQSVLVHFPTGQPNETTTGRIIHISSVVDAASETLQVRLEVANPEGRPAGERVSVEFGEGEAQGPITNEPPAAGGRDLSLTISPPGTDNMQRP